MRLLSVGLILMDGSGYHHSLWLPDTSFLCRILLSEEFTNDFPVSFDARSVEIGSAEMRVEPILGRIQSSEASFKPDDAANAESKF
jgi:hypothetical protein